MLSLMVGLGCSSTSAPETSVPPASTAPIRFIALGDVGKGNATQRAIGQAIGRVCAHQSCDFVLLLGDNLYPRGMDRDDDPRMDAVFTAMYDHLDLEFKVVLGNHDYGNGEPVRASRQLRYAARTPSFTMPDRFYRFDDGDASFLALDTDHIFFHGHARQAAWLDKELAASDARWKVVFGHHTYRSNGKHGNAGFYEGWGWIPYLSGSSLRTLFDDHVKGHADLYVSGHDHNLQVMEYDGLPLVVSGSGASARPFVRDDNVLDLGFEVPGFAWIELGDDLAISLYDENGTLLGATRYPHPRER